MGISSANQGSAENKSAYMLHLLLYSDADEMLELWLPRAVDGFFRFSNDPEYRFLSISAKDGQWTAACKKPAFFTNLPLHECDAVILREGQLLEISFEEHTYRLYADGAAAEQMVFHNYQVHSGADIQIGSHPGSDICYQNPHVPPRTATLRRDRSVWTLKSSGSFLGIYVNGELQQDCLLKLGDKISILGLQIIIGTNSIALNHADQLKLNTAVLAVPVPGVSGYLYGYGQGGERAEETFFNRLPRKKLDSEEKVITLEGPPMSMERAQMPLLLRMGSSLVMGGMSALAGNFTTLLSSVLFPFLSSKYTDQQRKDYEQLRLKKYTEYLEAKRLEIQEACFREKELLEQKYPKIDATMKLALDAQRLWERRPMDSDFLHLRLGTGSRVMQTVIDYPQRRFELQPDALEEKMYRLAEQTRYIEDAPITLSFVETVCCGLVGDRDRLRELVMQLIMQLAVYHSYDEVKLVFLLPSEELDRMDRVRYLPHVWDDQRSIRFVATTEPEAYAVGDYINTQVENDRDSKELKQILKKRPYYLVFAFDKKLLDAHEVWKNILQADENLGVSIITAFEDLPKETQKIITLSPSGSHVCTTLAENGGEDVRFSMEDSSGQSRDSVLRMLANTRLKIQSETQTMPKMVTFLEMMQAGRIEQLNPLRRWRENNPVSSLAAPVGVNADGSLFMLDLHEKRQGPHGLVAGMTGSGKSEFIITYILSMAVNYHPDEVAFLLIDYKGGGLAGAFENPQTGVRLPHLAGTITNLDGSSIQRSLMSIESELLRRQRIFKETSTAVNEGTVDIYSYQQLYRTGRVAEPMPHLFIISDEFAELKQQQPEFMDRLISAARIGRSLGVHLILATQKPSGVVNDQIWSNTKFRVCLKVQDKSDSMDMLKRHEAAELKDTGRFYLQVGYNEYFAMGQSAWCGAAYEPQDTVPEKRDDSVELLDITGQNVAKAKPTVKKTSSGKKQIVAVVEYLSTLAGEQNICCRQICPPEMPKELTVEDLPKAEKPMEVILGLLDDPENLLQFPKTVDFETCDNMLIVGDSSSGKTTILQNILLALTLQLPAEDLNYYILDYSSRMLRIFEPMPHCGAVLREENAEKLDDFFKLINGIIAERKKLFSDLEVDNFASARKKKRIPLVLVVIDNFAGMLSSKIGEQHGYKFEAYVKNSAQYGVKYVVACNFMTEMSSRNRLGLPERIALHMANKYEYGELLGCKVNNVLPELPGRGLVNEGGRPLEFQGLLQLTGKEPQVYVEHVKQQLLQRREQLGAAEEARHMPVYEDTAEYPDFVRQFKRGRIPLGISKQTGKPVVFPLKQMNSLSIYMNAPEMREHMVNNMLFVAKRERMEVWAVRRKTDSVLAKKKIDRLFDLSEASVAQLRSTLVKELTSRNDLFNQYCEEQKLMGTSEEKFKQAFTYLRSNTKPIMLLVESYADLCNAVDTMTALIFIRSFKIAGLRNIYVIGLFEPEDRKENANPVMYDSFNPDKNLLLLGGQFDKQTLCSSPQVQELSKIFPMNVGLIYYRNQAQALIMPCGVLQQQEQDEDDRPIF